MIDVRVYLDSVLVIYLVEQNPTFAPAVEGWLLAHPSDLVSSELVRMEALVLPVRHADARGIVSFERFFSKQIIEMVPLVRDVFERAIDIRAVHTAIRTPDAIHLAAAIVSGCDVFLTNDAHLKAYRGIPVELI
jgi:uncharacterized protein